MVGELPAVRVMAVQSSQINSKQIANFLYYKYRVGS